MTRLFFIGKAPIDSIHDQLAEQEIALEFLSEYGLFLLKAITIVAAVVIAFGGIVGISSKQKGHKEGVLEIVSLSDKLASAEEQAKQLVYSKTQFKHWKKSIKEQKKKDKHQPESGGKVFVIDFDGSVDASEVENLRKEISTVIAVADQQDEVLLRLESGGGTVVGYGLAASQLQRLKDRDIKLTVCVDKIAASGGYMMACIADQLFAAPFAVVGSIGVLAQLPNFNKLLRENNIEFEQITAGKYKRTLTMFGENDDQGRQKFQQEIEAVHQLFKDFVQQNRAQLDIEKVATGEYWHGLQALQLNLVDALQTSDDYLLQCYQQKGVYQVTYTVKKNIAEKLSGVVSAGLEQAAKRVWQTASSRMWH